jgi:WhiB family redox-sensing transcriptional regulator
VKRPAQPGLHSHLPAAGTDDEEWRLHGLCRGHHDPDPLWCPTDPRDAGAGVAICNTCPVRIRCAEYAMVRREKHGTWGGITEWEREYLLTGRYRRPLKPPKE